MIEGKHSQTASMVAAMRAYHNAFAPEPKILRDDMAMPLSGIPGEQALKAQFSGMIAQFAALSDQDTAEHFVRRITESVCMRSRLVEGQLETGAARGLKQLVILGAGLDSTAYRRTDLTAGLQVIEVDHPSTQAWKRERLAALGIRVPDNVKYVTFDFENQTLEEALIAGGVDQSAVTLFPWLGVQPYLTDAAVRATMKVVSSFPAGSEVVLDFVSPGYDNIDDINADGLAQLTQVVETMGEPFLSRYAPEALEILLRDCGFSDVTLHVSSELIERFLGGHKEAYIMPDSARILASATV